MRTPTNALLTAAFAAVAALLTTCSHDPDAADPAVDPPPNRPTKLLLDHDFGMVPHGEQRTHEFELDLSMLDNAVPLRVHLECSCGRADLRLRKADGSERFLDGTANPLNLPGPDERAILHIELDTRKKEAVDLPATVSRGYVLLQPLDDPTGMARFRWAFLVRFGIDAPVELKPFAAFDFGRVAMSTTASAMTTLRGDENHRDMRFLEVTSSDPNLTVALEPAEEHTVLRARCQPAGLGSHRALVSVRTSDPNYIVRLEASWKVVPDLEASPVDKISFRAPLDRPQADDATLRQFVLVTDHDSRRSPEFVLAALVDAAGRDASSHFAVTIQPVPTKQRQQRVAVRYLGGLTDTFRGKIVLAKPDENGNASQPELPIDLVVFPGKQP
ncbi:MAG TPA: hypothetical protein ENI87_02775 [bacterium]|nr:hypothetical protein [bacterium]